MLNKKGRKCPFFTSKKNVTDIVQKAVCATDLDTFINHYFRAQHSHRTIRLLCAIQMSSNLVCFVHPSHDQRKLKHDGFVTLD